MRHEANDAKCKVLGCVCVPMVMKAFGVWGTEAGVSITSGLSIEPEIVRLAKLQHGHEVLYTSPYQCDLQLIEMV